MLLETLILEEGGILFVENVGNLYVPPMWFFIRWISSTTANSSISSILSQLGVRAGGILKRTATGTTRFIPLVKPSSRRSRNHGSRSAKRENSSPCGFVERMEGREILAFLQNFPFCGAYYQGQESPCRVYSPLRAVGLLDSMPLPSGSVEIRSLRTCNL
jgi:hypothetical protein